MPLRKGVHFERDIQDISSRLLPAEAPEALAPPLTPVNSVWSPLYPPGPTTPPAAPCTRLPRDFFALLDGWLPTKLATDSVSISIGVARRSHAASGRPLLPGSDLNAA